jgi:hypothetical protein
MSRAGDATRQICGEIAPFKPPLAPPSAAHSDRRLRDRTHAIARHRLLGSRVTAID